MSIGVANQSRNEEHQILLTLEKTISFRQITLGRSTKDQSVDVDLKLEGPAWKISRRQGVIKLKTSGEFYITNEGKRCFFVDGKPVSM